MFSYNNISFKQLLNILFSIKVSKVVDENDIIQPFSKYYNLWKEIPIKSRIIHFWSILTEQCSNSFFPHPNDALILLILIYYSNERKHRCFLYMDDNHKIQALSIIYIDNKEETNLSNMIFNYFNQLPLIRAMINKNLLINIDPSYWRYIHSTLLIVNDTNIYNVLLNDIKNSLIPYDQIFMPEFKGIIITKYLSIHPLDEKYIKDILLFNEDIAMKDENDNQLYFKII
jgi:hypothetical protein